MAEDSRDDPVLVAIDTCADVKPSTIRGYKTHLRRLVKVCGVERVADAIADPKRAIDALTAKLGGEASASVNSVAQTAVAVKAALRHAPASAFGVDDTSELQRLWDETYRELERRVVEQRTSGRPTERQEGAMLKWADVYDKNVELRRRAAEPNAKPADLDDLVLSDFYVLLEPRRVLDYTRLFVVRSEADLDRVPDDATGFVNLAADPPFVRVRSYKTSATHGLWSSRLPDQLVRDLRASLDARPRDWVFSDAGGGPFRSQDTFSDMHKKRLLKWFGVPATTNSLRHARATQVVLDPTLSLKEKHLIAREMGHSWDMHQQYAFKPERDPATGAFTLSVFDPVVKRYVDYRCERVG